MRLNITQRKILQALSTETSLLVREVSRVLIADRQVRQEDSASIAFEMKLLRAEGLVESKAFSGANGVLVWRRTEKGTKALEEVGR